MERISDYKNRAIESLSGNWGKAALITFIYAIVVSIPTIGINITTGIKNAGSLWQVAMLPMSWSLCVFFLAIAHGEETKTGMLFDGFKDYWRIFTTMFLQGLYTALWTLLLIVPGIIKTYSYSMTPYILKDNPDMRNNEAIEKSMAMMNGHKMDLFLLDLSMIGWHILSILTLGIGYLFLLPYIYTTHAHFYEDLKKENEMFEVSEEQAGEE